MAICYNNKAGSTKLANFNRTLDLQVPIMINLCIIRVPRNIGRIIQEVRHGRTRKAKIPMGTAYMQKSSRTLVIEN